MNSNKEPIITLVDLLASNGLSANAVFRFEHEVLDASVGIPPEVNSIKHINAARVALLLSQAVHAGQDGAALGSTPLRLDDFRVKLESIQAFPEKKGGGAVLRNGDSELKDGPKILRAVDLVERDEKKSDVSGDELSLVKNVGQILHAIFSSGPEHQPLPSGESISDRRDLHENGARRACWGNDATSAALAPFGCAAGAPGGTAAADDGGNNKSSDRDALLLSGISRIAANHRKQRQNQQRQQQERRQPRGTGLRDWMASGKDDGSSAGEDRWRGKRVEKNSKIRREDESLFSTLMETGLYPVSVCRLLSDMIDDSGVISSLEEVVQELGQMSNNPQIYLFDQSHDFYSSNLLFGQGYYGRVNELTTLLGITNQIEASAVMGAGHSVDAVLVSGAAGSGKSFFVQYVRNILTNFGGWVVLELKFKRSSVHQSKEILSSLFDELVKDILLMKSSSNEKDAEYSRHAFSAISDALDPSSLASLARFIPSIQKLFPSIDTDTKSIENSDMSQWHMVFLLSQLVGAILGLDRRVMICMDDLQWCDVSTLRLVTEVLMSVSHFSDRKKQRLLFVGMYRDNEVNEGHPLSHQLSSLKKSYHIDVTEVKLSSLTRDDVADMIMSELRLPRRLVRGLAEAVQKKTSGHAIFVVQLLNSLVRDSVIAYSPRKRRFDWDDSKISSLKTCDTVASLIVSNLSNLKPKSLQSLRILSCFGVQVDKAVPKLLDSNSSISPEGGIELFLPDLVERGILDTRRRMVFFSHDLIQQHVYEDIPLDERRRLHLEIGTALGSMTNLDASSRKSSIDGGVDHLCLSDCSSERETAVKPAILIRIATDQVNVAGPAYVASGSQRTRFAGWNRCAGQYAEDLSNFQDALYNYKNGIAFLKDALWLGDSTTQLCRELHEGAAFASFALGNIAEVKMYATAIIDHVPFDDSLAAQGLLIRALKGAGKYEEVIARGIAVLRLLNIDIPSAPSAGAVIQTMSETGKVLACFLPQIASLKQASVDTKKRNILKIADAVIVACYREASPFLPLVSCAMLNYALSNGVAEESAASLMVFGYFSVFLADNFVDGRRCGEAALELMDTSSTFTSMIIYAFVSESLLACVYFRYLIRGNLLIQNLLIASSNTRQLLFWFIPHRKVACVLLETYETSMKMGDVDNAMMSLCLSLRFSFFSGEKLSLLAQSYRRLLRLTSKYNKEILSYAVPNSLLVDSLTGSDSKPFDVFEGMIRDEDVLLADAKSRRHTRGVEAIYLLKFYVAFWDCDYPAANKWLGLMSALPSSRMPKVELIHRSFYQGLISFQLNREGKGVEWLEKGTEVLQKMELWTKNSQDIFQNKLVLLEAESHACNCNIVAAKESYELAAETARDHGLVHEQGLASELYGKFLTSIVEIDEAGRWFQRAHECYTQWGAFAKADKLRRDHKLILSPDEVSGATLASTKREVPLE